MDQREVCFIAPFIVIAFQHRGGEIELAQDIAETRGDALATLQASAQHRHGDVGQQRQVRAQTVHVLVVATGAIAGRRAACQPAGQTQPEAADFVTADVTNVFKQQFVESVNIIVLRGGHFIQYVRMAANRP